MSIIGIYNIAIRFFMRDPAFYLLAQAFAMAPVIVFLLNPKNPPAILIGVLFAACSYPLLILKIRSHFYAETFDLNDAFTSALKKFIPYLLSTALALMISALGLLLLIIPGAKWFLDYALLPAALYGEKESFDSLKFSKAAMYGNHFKFIGLVLTWVLIALPIFYMVPDLNVLRAAKISLANYVFLIPILFVPTLFTLTYGVFYYYVRSNLPAKEVYEIPAFSFFKTAFLVAVLGPGAYFGGIAALQYGSQYFPNEVHFVRTFIPTHFPDGISIVKRFIPVRAVSPPQPSPIPTPTFIARPAAPDPRFFATQVLRATATANSYRYRGEVTKMRWVKSKSRYVLEFDKYSSSHLFTILASRNKPTVSDGLHMVHENLLSCVRQKQTHACSLGLDIDDPKAREFYKKRVPRLPMSATYIAYSGPKGTPGVRLGIGFYFFDAVQKKYFSKMKISNLTCDPKKPVCAFLM